MSLLITITKAPDLAALAESSKTFDMQGGTIGRGKDNSWILDDPERFLSSRHCEFSNENGQFFITDLSTNGTFYNGASTPIGKGSKLPLKDGDTFLLGDYEFSVSLKSQAPGSAQQENFSNDPFGSNSASDSPFSSADPFASPDNSFSQGSDFGSDPFSTGHVSSSESLFNTSTEETDPLAALDKAQGGGANNNSLGNIDNAGFGSAADPFQSPAGSDPFAGPTHSDQADPLNQQVSWPNAVQEQSDFSGGGIPDDWDDDLLSPSAPAAPVPAQTAPVAPTPSPAIPKSTPLTEPPVVPKPAAAQAPAAEFKNQAVSQKTAQVNLTEGEITPAQQSALEQANAKIQAELEMLKQQISAQQQVAVSQPPVNANVNVDTLLINAMGFENKNLGDEDIKHINQLTGEVVREMVSGLMQVLGSRSSIKNEFRMNVTTIQPVENNPLKFSANVDDALENMFIKQGNAYKKPVDAVREGFNGIAEHQVAILAGIRAAFKGVIERFDPALLEQRFAKQNKGGLIPGSHKAKNWELYLDYYNELAGDIDNSFQYLFGDDFVQAYEDQLQKLAIARKPAKKPK